MMPKRRNERRRSNTPKAEPATSDMGDPKEKLNAPGTNKTPCPASDKMPAEIRTVFLEDECHIFHKRIAQNTLLYGKSTT